MTSAFDDDDIWYDVTKTEVPKPRPRTVAGGFSDPDEIIRLITSVGEPLLRVTPVGENKIPIEKGWTGSDYFGAWSLDVAKRRVDEWFELYTNPNFAFVLGELCGPAGDMVLEADNQAGEDWLRANVPQTPVVVRREGGLVHRHYAPFIDAETGEAVGTKIDILRSKRKWREEAIKQGFDINVGANPTDAERDWAKAEYDRALKAIAMGPIIDLKSRASQAMCPGSLHPSGGRYVAVEPWSRDLWSQRPVFDKKWFPDEYWQEVRSSDFAASLGMGAAYDRKYWTPQRRLEAALKYASRRPGAVSGQNGHAHTIRTATLLIRGFDLDRHCAQLAMEQWNQSCSPPWDTKDLNHKIDEAFKGRGRGDEPMGFKLVDRKRAGVAGRMDEIAETMEREALERAKTKSSNKNTLAINADAPTLVLDLSFDDDNEPKTEAVVAEATTAPVAEVAETPQETKDIVVAADEVLPPSPFDDAGEYWQPMDGEEGTVSTGTVPAPTAIKGLRGKSTQTFGAEGTIAVNRAEQLKEVLKKFDLDDEECRRQGVHLIIDYQDNEPPRLPPAPVNIYAVLRFSRAWKNRLTLNMMTLNRHLDGEEIDERMAALMRYRMDFIFHKVIGKDMFDEAVTAVCMESKVDPLKEIFEDLPPWDGQERLKFVARDILGVTVNLPEAAMLTEKFFLCLAARILRPGCKVDTAYILRGGQGAFKSTFFQEIIGPQYFTDQPMALNDKDSRILLANHAIIEWSELEHVISPKKVDQVKAFLSQQTDKIRLPYARSMTTMPRRCVIVGSTNLLEIVHDDTGSRRFWIVEVPGRVAIDVLRAQREQLLAEAKHRVLGHLEASDAGRRRSKEFEYGRWWLNLDEDAKRAAINEEYRPREPWIDSIQEWVDARAEGDLFTVGDCVKGIGVALERRDTDSERRVSRAMALLGCRQENDGKLMYHGKRRGRFWRKPESKVQPSLPTPPPPAKTEPKTEAPPAGVGVGGAIDDLMFSDFDDDAQEA